MLGWEPNISFDSALEKMVDWATKQKVEDKFEIANNELKERGLI